MSSDTHEAHFSNVWLNCLDKSLHRIFSAAVSAPKLVIFLWLLVLTLLGSQIPNIRVAISVSEIVEPTFQSVQQTRTMHELYGEKITAFLIVRPEVGTRGLAAEELAAVESWIGRQRKNNGGRRSEAKHFAK